MILGPTTPPPLSVQVLKWMNDPDLALRFRAAAAALVQLALVVGALTAWWTAERVVAWFGLRWIEKGGRGRCETELRAMAMVAVILTAATTVLGLAGLAVWSFAGLCAGMFGVGGGIVKGPLMLEMGVHPQVASATSACMILYTTSTATVSFWIFGLLQADYAGVLFLIGVVATWVGQTLVNQYIKRSGRNSMVVFSIGIVIFLSCLLMGYQGISALFSGTTAPPGSICEAGGE
jgi:ABC-type uncharacterized transport system YnjBCD permease subunit